MFFRLAGASGQARMWFRLAGVSGSTTGSIAVVQMSGRGTTNVALPAMFFRLAGVSGATSGAAAAFNMAGSGQMFVNSGASVTFRLADVRGYSPNATLTWNGTAWVTETFSVTVAMAGAGVLAIPAPGVGTAVNLDGVGQMLLSSARVNTFAVIPMPGVGNMYVSFVPPPTGAVSMDGTSVLTLSGSFVLVGTGTYRYTPPTYRMVHSVERGHSLRFGIDTMTVTYRKGGVWVNTQIAGIGELDGADIVITVPTVVSTPVATELAAFGVGTLVPT